VIRPARPEDVPGILALVQDLAEYERARDQVEATEEQLREALFGADPHVFALVAEHEGRLGGFAVWFLTFSTWLGRHGIYLEDLFVRPELRGLGYGRELLRELARICVAEGYGRLEWAVLDWNEPAIGFYRALGAQAQDEWTVHRISGDALDRLAAETG
jgi:GNAT superfamily N-acetyltransferase